ncbi:MAG: carboxypeptidase regulatory-like domain-containing protein [Bryobacterales bacterium]|nr:carboxypeptidase regulatory-like domain-containing protein [Bryobacterales bacterium]
MSRSRRLLALLALLALLPLPAIPCSCASLPACDKPKHAGVVFLGLALQSFSQMPMLTRFEVQEVLSGKLAEREILIGNSLPCMYHFDPGQAYIVFAAWGESQKRFTTSLCAGNLPADSLGALAMLRERRSKGSVTGVFGSVQSLAPIPGIPVTFLSKSGAWRAKTGPDGLFRIPQLPPGVYDISVPSSQGQAANQLRASVYAHCDVFDIKSRGNSKVSGRILGTSIPDGSSILLLNPSDRRIIGEAWYSPRHSGRFSFPEVLAGEYLLAADLPAEAGNRYAPPFRIYYPNTTDPAKARKIKVRAGHNTAGLPFALQAPPKRTITIGARSGVSISIVDVLSGAVSSMPGFHNNGKIALFAGRRYRLIAHRIDEKYVHHSPPVEVAENSGNAFVELRVTHDGFEDRCRRCYRNKSASAPPNSGN